MIVINSCFKKFLCRLLRTSCFKIQVCWAHMILSFPSIEVSFICHYPIIPTSWMEGSENWNVGKPIFVSFMLSINMMLYLNSCFTKVVFGTIFTANMMNIKCNYMPAAFWTFKNCSGGNDFSSMCLVYTNYIRKTFNVTRRHQRLIPLLNILNHGSVNKEISIQLTSLLL